MVSIVLMVPCYIKQSLQLVPESLDDMPIVVIVVIIATYNAWLCEQRRTFDNM